MVFYYWFISLMNRPTSLNSFAYCCLDYLLLLGQPWFHLIEKQITQTIAKVKSSLQLIKTLKNAAQCCPKQNLSGTCNQNCSWTIVLCVNKKEEFKFWNKSQILYFFETLLNKIQNHAKLNGYLEACILPLCYWAN